MKHSLFIVVILSFTISFVACNKGEDKKLKVTKYEVEGSYVMPKMYALSGYNIKDTVNDIYGAILIPLSRIEDNQINIKPITTNIGTQMQDFVNKVKQKSSNKKIEGKNFIEIRPVYFVFHDDNIYSCLVKKTSYFPDKDTLKTYNTILYDYREEEMLDFDDVFSVDKSNFTDFISLFPKDIPIKTLENLKQTDFNIEIDSISFNANLSSPENYYIQKQFKQSIETLRPYFKNKKQFAKE